MKRKTKEIYRSNIYDTEWGVKVPPHPQENEILNFIETAKNIKTPIKISSCETVNDVKKFLEVQKSVIKNKTSLKQYKLSIERLKRLKSKI